MTPSLIFEALRLYSVTERSDETEIKFKTSDSSRGGTKMSAKLSIVVLHKRAYTQPLCCERVPFQ